MNIDIKHIAKLSRLSIDETELLAYENEMLNMIAMVDKMPNISEELHVDENNAMALREDTLSDTKLARDVILANAPKVVAGCVVVPKTVE